MHLKSLGQDIAKFKDEQALNPKKSFFRYEFEQFTLDLLPVLKAPLKFGMSFQNRVVVTLGGINIPIIGFDDLIADKVANGRPKDIADVGQLKSLKLSNNI